MEGNKAIANLRQFSLTTAGRESDQAVRKSENKYLLSPSGRGGGVGKHINPICFLIFKKDKD